MKMQLKELRKARGWTQAHVAKEAGMSVSYYADMERGDKRSNTTRQAALAKVFGVEVSELFETDSDPADVNFRADFDSLSEEDRQRIRDLTSSLAKAQRQAS